MSDASDVPAIATPNTLAYQSFAERRRVFAWLPTACLLIVVASPGVFELFFGLSSQRSQLLRDFGIRISALTSVTLPSSRTT